MQLDQLTMKRSRSKRNNLEQIQAMLPRSLKQLLKIYDVEELGVWLVVAPNQVVFSVPKYTDLTTNAARSVRQTCHRRIKQIKQTYTEKYKLAEFKVMPRLAAVVAADLEVSYNQALVMNDKDMVEYLSTVNVMHYLNQRCIKCDHYATEVGFNDKAESVVECVACGHIFIDSVASNARLWVINLIGKGKNTYDH